MSPLTISTAQPTRRDEICFAKMNENDFFFKTFDCFFDIYFDNQWSSKRFSLGQLDTWQLDTRKVYALPVLSHRDSTGHSSGNKAVVLD
jgi:hypothetical protein